MKPVAIFLFEKSGRTAAPWARDGWECFCVDIAHKENHTIDGVHFVKADARHWKPTAEMIEHCEFFCAMPPCDHLAVSGARWFKGKGLRALASSIELFAVAAEWAESLGVPYFIENPVSTMSTYWRKPDYTFNPYDYTLYAPEENYAKKTCLWVGNGFVMPAPAPMPGQSIDNRIHAAPPGPDRKDFRSATPKGFVQAVYNVNYRQHECAAKAMEAAE